jgi:hypothetical protein
VTPPRIVLTDEPDGVERSASAMMVSLASRLAALFMTSGAETAGAWLAGLADLGRRVGQTAEGARLRRALESGRVATSGEALWRELKIDDWLADTPPGPILENLRNDVALLLADDLFDVLAARGSGYGPLTFAAPAEASPGTFLDVLIGMWAFGRELSWAVETLAAPTLGRANRVDERQTAPGPEYGPLLR